MARLFPAAPHHRPSLSTAAAMIAVSALALSLGGCLNRSGPETTGALRPAGTPATLSAQQVEALGQRYDQNPSDRGTVLAYAAALRASGQHAQALAVLEKAAVRASKDTEVLGAYGRSLIDNGRYAQAEDVLSRAHTPERPDWRILSAQGTAADQAGAHERAQGYYQAALKIMPEEPTVLSNLGLSYALSRRLPEAEAALRRAAQSPNADERVRQNLALVASLRAKPGAGSAAGVPQAAPRAATLRTIPAIPAASLTATPLSSALAAPVPASGTAGRQTNTWAAIAAADRTTGRGGGTVTAARSDAEAIPGN